MQKMKEIGKSERRKAVRSQVFIPDYFTNKIQCLKLFCFYVSLNRTLTYASHAFLARKFEKSDI